MKIIVHTPFTLTRDDGTQTRFDVGEHDLHEADAEHWYTRLFSEIAKVESVAAKARSKV